ncbi:MAG: lamin tail domain-containing protein [Bacteroidetes bacterium]|nr:MAG: lamin tail domain-containing protein [Bacteroidota bacterium]
MNIKSSYLCALCFVLTLGACKTEDVDPIIKPDLGSLVSLSINTNTIAEAGGTVELTATLSKVSTATVEVKLAYSGKATFGNDYSSNVTLVIPAGSLTNATTVLAIQDTAKEGTEDIIIAIDSVTGGSEDGTQIIAVNIEDDDAPATVNLILNEILYDPSNTGLEGDANGDGVYAQAADEFIELVNNSTKAVDLSGYKIFDAGGLASGTPNHLIPNGTVIQPGKALVIFGGGTPTGTFGGATVQKSTSGDLNLNNAGDVLTIKDGADNVILTYDITPLSDNPNESYTRNPDLIGVFEQHQDNFPVKFSPGTKVNGAPF